MEAGYCYGETRMDDSVADVDCIDGIDGVDLPRFGYVDCDVALS